MMKKLSILAVAFAAIAFAACGNKSASNTESADSVFFAVLFPQAANAISANATARIDNFFIAF